MLTVRFCNENTGRSHMIDGTRVDVERKDGVQMVRVDDQEYKIVRRSDDPNGFHIAYVMNRHGATTQTVRP